MDFIEYLAYYKNNRKVLSISEVKRKNNNRTIMINCDNTLEECSNYVLNCINSILTSNPEVNILENPTIDALFNKELLQYNWKPLENINVSDLNKDLLTDLTLKKIITDLFTVGSEALNLSFDNSNNNNDGTTNNNKESTDALIGKLRIAALVLDLCFHSRQFRQDITLWKITYFDLFGLTINLLSWPIDISKFWIYAESRIEWFKIGNSADPDHYNGMSQLISYKPPLSDKLRHWNDILKLLEYNSALNTPLDYIMKYKLEKFISNLLPINEESNFNRSAIISKKQDSGTTWNARRLLGRPNTSEENMTQDYKFVFNKFISSPVEFTFKSVDFKLDVEKPLYLLLDALFDTEDDFYKRIKYIRRKQLLIEDKINPNFRSDFNFNSHTIPGYISESIIFQNDRTKMWKDIESFHNPSLQIVRPTFLDMSSQNYSVLYKQLTSLENDYYRKQFMLQVIFACKIVEKLLTMEDVKAFYKNCYAKENMLKFLNFDDLDELNIRKTKSLCHNICEMRVKTFYATRDPIFYKIIHSLEQNDELYINAKIDGFKFFNNCNLSLNKNENNHVRENVNYQFKKFGFIKLGNKQINNVWKIQSGLESIVENTIDPKDIYDRLKEKYRNNNPNTKEADEIMKQWQTLRSLRSQYLFEFNKFNETISLKGLFDQSTVENNTKEMDKFEELQLKIKESHRNRLKKAREHQKAKEVLKRKIDDVEITENTSEDDSRETTSNKNKKLKQDNNIEVQKSVSPTLNEHNSESENNENGINEQLLNKDITIEQLNEQNSLDNKNNNKEKEQHSTINTQKDNNFNLKDESTTNEPQKEDK